VERTVRITNPKLDGVAPPSWRTYPGVSILYDAPGCAAVSGVERLDALPRAGDGSDPLDRELSALAGELETGLGEEGVTLCPLPRRTYHVTLCDVVNQGSRKHVAAGLRQEVAATLDGLPDSLLWPTTLLRLLADPELYWQVWRQPLSFRVAGLEVRGQALVAALEPADERSAAAKAAHERSRAALADRLTARLGVALPEWRPHLTLGYFANDEAAGHASDAVERWQQRARERTDRLAATFRSAAVYGFTDMASFWRLGH
jgi:hypothetical protein